MTKKQRRQLERDWQTALELAGGPTALAAFISSTYGRISRQAVADWMVCPPLRAVQVAAAIRARGHQMPPQHIRRDLYEPAAA